MAGLNYRPENPAEFQRGCGWMVFWIVLSWFALLGTMALIGVVGTWLTDPSFDLSAFIERKWHGR